MIVRRALLVAAMMVLLWAAPAHAQSYGDVLGTSLTQGNDNGGGNGNGNGNGNGVIATSGGPGEGVKANNEANGNLARTGSNDIAPLVQAGIVLVGGGMLLVLVARRRRAVRRALV